MNDPSDYEGARFISPHDSTEYLKEIRKIGMKAIKHARNHDHAWAWLAIGMITQIAHEGLGSRFDSLSDEE